MARERSHVTYDLKQGNKVVYRGITNDPERRLKEHEAQGKQFSVLHITSVKMSHETAKRKEAENLERYRSSHSGDNPLYNLTNNG